MNKRIFVKNNITEIAMFAILFAIIIFCLLFYSSSDFSVTVSHGVFFWDALFSGKGLNIYTYYMNNPYTITAMYDVPIYIIFALWNIPTYIIYRCGIQFQLDMYTLKAPVLLWNELLLVLITYGIIVLLRKIICDDNNDEIRIDVVFMLLSSFLYCYATFIVNQYDIFSIFLSLIGIYSLKKNNYKRFVLFFSIASGFKFFPILIFIGIVLLVQKNIVNILLSVICTLVMPLALKLLYINDSAYAYTKQFTNEKMKYLFEEKVPGMMSEQSIIVILLLMIFVYAYFTTCNNKIETKAMYLSLAIYSVVFSFMNTSPYWLVMIIPYLVAIIIFNRDYVWKTRINILLFALLEISAMILILYNHHDNLDYSLLRYGVNTFFRDNTSYFSVYSLIHNRNLDFVINIISACYVCSLGLLLLLNRNLMSDNDNYEAEKKDISKYNLLSNKSVKYIKLIILLLFIVITISSYFIEHSYWFDSHEMQYTKMGVSNEEGVSASKDSIIFGPYCYLAAGNYEIKVYAKGLTDSVGIEMAADDITFPISDVKIDNNILSFKTTIAENADNSEIRLYTNQNDIIFKGMSINAVEGM